MERVRITDLARSVGISVQQVRNYVDLGLLPAVERTDSGYRIFTRRHAQALDTVRKLIDGHGHKRAIAIMRAVHVGDLETALREVDAGHAELDRERAEIASVLGAFDSVVADSPAAEPGSRSGASIGETARSAGARTSALRVWEDYGLLEPRRDTATGYRVYDAFEQRLVRVVALLRRGGFPFPIVRAVLAELRTAGSPERLRAELARREQELHHRSLRRLRASAALYAYLGHEGRD